MFDIVDCLKVRNSFFMSIHDVTSWLHSVWFILCVNMAWLKGAQTFGPTIRKKIPTSLKYGHLINDIQ